MFSNFQQKYNHNKFNTPNKVQISNLFLVGFWAPILKHIEYKHVRPNWIRFYYTAKKKTKKKVRKKNIKTHN